MLICFDCGQSLPANVIFCLHCGKKVFNPEGEEETLISPKTNFQRADVSISTIIIPRRDLEDDGYENAEPVKTNTHDKNQPLRQLLRVSIGFLTFLIMVGSLIFAGTQIYHLQTKPASSNSRADNAFLTNTAANKAFNMETPPKRPKAAKTPIEKKESEVIPARNKIVMIYKRHILIKHPSFIVVLSYVI